MDIEKALNKILWGKALVKASGQDGKAETFALRSLTLQENNEMQFLRETVLQECEEDGIVNKEELTLILKEAEAWTSKEEDRISELEQETKKLKHGIKQAEFNKTKRRILEKSLSRTTEELQVLSNQKIDLFSLTAEARAEEYTRRYMIFKSATDKFGNQFWNTEEEFLDCTDSELVNNLTLGYIDSHIMTEAEVRKIARSGMWRFRWSASKNGESLFGKPVSEWSDLQSTLVYWSQFYDYVYESPDKPNDMVIENDSALDGWVHEQEGKNSTTSNGMSGKSGHQEQFIVVPDADSETIEQVHSLNSKKDREQISRERKEIKEKGRVSEWELRKGNLKG